MEKLGIEDVKPLFSAVLHASEILVDASKDGFSLTDLPAFLKLVPLVPKLVSVEYGKVLPELKDLSPEEAKELADLAKSEFDLADDELEGKVESGLQVAAQLYGLCAQALELGKSLLKK